VGTYQPSYYAVVGWPTRWLAPDHGVLAARIVSAVLVAALVASALTTAATFAGAATVTAVLLAITPAFVYLTGVVNPSSVETAASLLLWCTLLALFTNPGAPRRVVIRAAVAAVCLVAVRPLSPAIAVAILASVVVLWAEREVLAKLWARRSVRLASLGVGVAFVASSAHVLATDAFNSIIVDATPEQRSALTLAREAVGNTWDLAQEQVGLLGPLGVFSQRTSPGYVQAWLIAVIALVLVALVVGANRRRAGLLLVVVGSLSAPVVASLANPDAIWLGRYSLPLAMGIPIVAGWIIDREGQIPIKVRSALLAVVGTFVAVVYLLDYRGLFRRNLFEYADAIAARLPNQLWDGPLTAEGARIAAALASLAVAGVAVLWAVLLIHHRDRDHPGEDAPLPETAAAPSSTAIAR
jgi:hypothetical protein